MKIQAANNPMVYGNDPKTSKAIEEKLEVNTQAKKEENDKIGRPNEDRVNVSPQTEKPVTYQRPKAMSSEQMREIKESITNRNAQFLQQMMAGNTKNQAASAMGSMDFLFASNIGQTQLPGVGQTQAEAKASISKGGAYSVEAVAGRIMDMAESLAGGDSKKLATLKKAVEKGFSAAGVDFKKATGKGLPSISQDTFDEVMKRFDDLEKKIIKPDTKSAEKPATTPAEAEK